MKPTSASFILVLLLLASSAEARPAYKKALVDLLELPASSRLNDCRSCHLSPQPGADESDRPHNSFGARLKAVKAELRKAGKPTDILTRLLAVQAEDSDGDGVPNLLELLAGTHPGESSDRPSAAAVELARKRQDPWLESLRGYRWRPFERVERPSLPSLQNRHGIRHPIDLFVRAEQEKRGLLPRPEASRPILLRRVYLDLIGLPPTPEELHAFLEDTRPDAYERVVDRLLHSPHYGERWGRHWMDVWRYSDWAGWGAQVRDSQPHIWHWRDWIVESLNEDRPYDRMVQEMLAADELSPLDPKALRATGYLVRNFKLLSREKWMQDTVDHTAMAFLGVTLGCAKCHDHMYDPITQKEYYQVRAIFTPHHVRTDRLPGWPDTQANGLPRAYDKDLDAKTFLFVRGDDRLPDKAPLPPAVPEALGGTFEPTPVSLPRYAQMPDRRPFVIAELIQGFEKSVALHDQDVAQADRRLRLQPLGISFLGSTPARLAGLGSLLVVNSQTQATKMAREAGVEVLRKYRLLAEVERLEDAGQTGQPAWEKAAQSLVESERRFEFLKTRNHLFNLRQGLTRPDPKAKQTPAQQLAAAEKAASKAEANLRQPPSTKYTPRAIPTYPPTSTGRRLAFAKWLVHRDNPLAARVAVNHIWLRHFGKGIVPGAFDFGKNGQPPSHPALLDWLAVEFMESGWSMKQLHRWIVTSATYRQASTPSPENLARDPDNLYLWRFSPRRLEAEVVRDALFAVTDRLDRQMGGPDLPHAQGLQVPRRSIYFQHAQEKQMEFLQIFDVASVTECYVRKQAILPQQALALLNSDLVRTQARQLTEQLPAETSATLVRTAFERVLSRAPTEEELDLCLQFLRDQGTKLQGANPSQRARENLLQVLFNHHEFVTLR